VDVVERIHSQNVIHRDLKIGNIFASSDNDSLVFVNDLGSAVVLGDTAPFGGTMHFASDSALASAVSRTPKQWKRSDDLESVVKVAFAFNSNPTVYSKLRSCSNFKDVLTFWKRLPSTWIAALDIARSADIDSRDSYRNLKICFGTLLMDSSSSTATTPPAAAAP
jgi:serine/threonine protein kinase